MMNYSAAVLSTLQNAGIRRTEVPTLPRGWIREEIPKFPPQFHNGNGHGRMPSTPSFEVVYYSPKGQRIRSKPELAKALGDQYDVTAFDFTTGQINPLLLRTSAKPGPSVSSGGGGGGGGSGGRKSSKPVSSTNRNEAAMAEMAKSAKISATNEAAALVPPIRQTASIFKQPVTVAKITRDTKEDAPLKAKPDTIPAASSGSGSKSGSDRPRQLFWEKRLCRLSASYADDDPSSEDAAEEDAMEVDGQQRQKQQPPFKLPPHFRPIGPGVETGVQVLASLSTSLHLTTNGTAIIGQSNEKAMKDHDPSAFLNPDQPLIHSTKISATDVEKQEARVADTRRKLAEAMAAISA